MSIPIGKINSSLGGAPRHSAYEAFGCDPDMKELVVPALREFDLINAEVGHAHR